MPTNRYDTIRSGSRFNRLQEVAQNDTNNTHVNNTKENYRFLSEGQVSKIKELQNGGNGHKKTEIRSRNRTALRILETAQPCGTTIPSYYKEKEKPQNAIVFDSPDLQHGFAQVPRLILCDPTLSSDEVRLYALFLSYAWQDQSTFVGQMTLAEDMGCSTDTIGRLIKRLVKRKLIRVERHGQGKSNTYHIRKFTDGYIPKQCVDRGHH